MKTVEDAMTRPVIAVRPMTPLKEVARLLVENGISGLPVVDGRGHVLGVISEGDLLVKAGGPQEVRHRRLSWLLGDSAATKARLTRLAATTAGGAMTVPAVTIEAASPIRAAAALMTERQVNRLPVVEDGRLVGIVSRADLVRSFVRSDDELAATIRQDVILRALWLDPAHFEVSVRDGVATVVGHVERRSTAEMVGRVVGLVPGVVDVRTDISWSIEDEEIEAPSPDWVSAIPIP